MKKTLVIGASIKPERYSNKAVRLLKKMGYPVVAVGGREGQIEDVKIHKGQPYFADIHTITVYLSPKRQEGLLEYILKLKPKRVIFNPGTENYEIFPILEQNGIEIVQNCTLVMLRSGLS